MSSLSRWQVVLLLIAVTLVGQSAVRANNLAHILRTGELEVCAKANALPYSARDHSPAGFQIELAELLARKLGTELKLSWVNLRWQARNTRCDAFMGVPVVSGEEPGPIRLSEPYTSVSMLLVTAAHTAPINTLADLQALTVAVPSGSLLFYTLKEHKIATVERFFNDQDLLQTLQSGEADAAIVSNMGLGWFLQQHPQFKTGTVISTDFINPRSRYNYAVALRKADTATVEWINALLRELRQTGELAALFQRYGIAYQAPLPD